MISLIELVNQGSRPRSSVTVATTATRIAGSTATRLKRATIRTCRPAAAAPARRSRISFFVCHATMPISRMIRAPFRMNTHTTTSWVGRIGVAPDRTRNVVRAEVSAARTAAGPSQPKLRRGWSAVWRCA
jgi:hypothetical protein